MGRQGRVVGVDFGAVRVGIAVSDSARTLASARTILDRESDARLIDKIAAIVAEEHANLVVVGLPLSMNGARGPAASKAEGFVEAMRRRIAVEIVTEDERLTSVEAARRLRAPREGRRAGRGQKARVDDLAAEILLQAYLDRGALE